MSYSWIMRNLPKNSQIATIGTYINSNMAELTEAMNDRLEELTGDDYEIVEKAILDGTGQDASRYMESLLVRYPDLHWQRRKLFRLWEKTMQIQVYLDVEELLRHLKRLRKEVL